MLLRHSLFHRGCLVFCFSFFFEFITTSSSTPFLSSIFASSRPRFRVLSPIAPSSSPSPFLHVHSYVSESIVASSTPWLPLLVHGYAFKSIVPSSMDKTGRARVELNVLLQPWARPSFLRSFTSYLPLTVQCCAKGWRESHHSFVNDTLLSTISSHPSSS